MEYRIRLDDLIGKSIIRFAGKENEINFSDKNTHVKVFFDDDGKPFHNIFAELHIAETYQSQNTVFELKIPQSAKTAVIVLGTNSNDYDLKQLQAVAL